MGRMGARAARVPGMAVNVLPVVVPVGTGGTPAEVGPGPAAAPVPTDAGVGAR